MTITDPFEERINKFAEWQGPRFQMGNVCTVFKGIGEEWEGGGRGERERACYTTAHTSDLEARPLPQ